MKATMKRPSTRQSGRALDYVEVVRKHCGNLQEAMQRPWLSSSFLWAEGLISRDTHRRLLHSSELPSTKTSAVITEILSVLEVSANAERDMTAFCEALEKSREPAVLKVVAEMRKAAGISHRYSKLS